jgi:hypothetical protein
VVPQAAVTLQEAVVLPVPARVQAPRKLGNRIIKKKGAPIGAPFSLANFPNATATINGTSNACNADGNTGNDEVTCTTCGGIVHSTRSFNRNN